MPLLRHLDVFGLSQAVLELLGDVLALESAAPQLTTVHSRDQAKLKMRDWNLLLFNEFLQ